MGYNGVQWDLAFIMYLFESTYIRHFPYTLLLNLDKIVIKFKLIDPVSPSAEQICDAWKSIYLWFSIGFNKYYYYILL